MIHPNPFISAFIGIPEWSWKNHLREWLAFSPWVPDGIQDFSPLKGYEFYRQLQPGDVVVDAGAYPGDYALFAAKKVGPDGRVLAFEPGAKNRAVLERNILKAGLSNVTVVPKGLWNCEKTLFLNENGLATAVQSDSGLEIEVVTLDAALQELGISKIQVLKMDIEGAEIEALEGAKQTLISCEYACIASYHIVDGTTTSARVEAFLRSANMESKTDYPKHATTYGWRTEIP
jgi:FkbM family methyltransferase